jgi:hypothetical protein
MVAHSQPSPVRPAVAANLPAGVFASNTNYSSGPSFFERLFGPPTPPPSAHAPRPPRRVIAR